MTQEALSTGQRKARGQAATQELRLVAGLLEGMRSAATRALFSTRPADAAERERLYQYVHAINAVEDGLKRYATDGEVAVREEEIRAALQPKAD